MRTARWPLSIAALAAPMAMAELPPKVAPAQPSLVRRTPELRFDEIALSDVIEFFRDATNANLVVDWKALQEAGIEKTTPVTLRLRGVSIGVALKKSLDAAAPGQLAFYVDQNVIQITTQAVADSRLVTRVYDVADLLRDVPDFDSPPGFSLSGNGGGSRTSRGGGGGGGSSGGSLFGGGGGGSQTTSQNKPMAERATDLIGLIQSTVRPEVWDVNGGKAAIRYSGGRLVITAPVAVQQLIGG